jgi:hypothetical protein
MVASLHMAESSAEVALENACGGRTVTDIHWSVDVILASSLLRSTRLNATPMINLSLTLDDGRVLSYRLTQEELHQWRYTLARGLKDLDYLERKRRAAPTIKGQKSQA